MRRRRAAGLFCSAGGGSHGARCADHGRRRLSLCHTPRCASHPAPCACRRVPAPAGNQGLIAGAAVATVAIAAVAVAGSQGNLEGAVAGNGAAPASSSPGGCSL